MNDDITISFDKVYGSLPIAVAYSELDTGKFIKVNDLFCEMTGYAREEIIGKTSLEFNMWKYPEERIAISNELREKGKVLNREFTILHKNGETRHGLFSAEITPNNTFLSFGIDITKQIEKEQYYEDLVELLPIGMAVYSLKTKQKLFSNKQARKMINRPLDDDKPESVFESVHPDSIEEGKRRIKELQEKGYCPASRMKFLSHDKKEAIEMEVISKLITYKNQKASMVLFNDISEKLKLESLERQYKDLVELLPSSIIVYNIKSMEIVFANPAACQLIGADNYKDLVGDKVMDYVHPDYRSVVKGRIKNMIETGETNEPLDEKFFKKDGSIIDVEVVAKPIIYKNKQSILVIFYDISEKLNLEEQLRQAAKLEAIGLLAGGVAHDFNNILTVIRGHTELLIRRSQKCPETEPHIYLQTKLEKIDNAADRAEALTKQLLAFSRKQILTPEVVNLNNILENEIKVLATLIREDIEIAKHLDPDLGNCFVDVNQISLVMMNMIINARDAIPEQDVGLIRLETKNIYFDEDHVERKQKMIDKGRYIMFSVTDDGVGMDMATKERIFEPFFTTKEMGKGVGLGLSTAYGIIKQSGGFVWVYSEIGQGTAFKVYLPRVDRETKNEIQINGEILDYSGNESLLLVEDEKEVRLLLCDALRDMGYKVICASNGIEAIEVMKNNQTKINMLVTDVVMPRMDGRELAIQLSDFIPNLKVLYMSGYTDNTIVHRGVLDPGTNFIQKPVTPTSLARKIREILDGT